MKLTMSALLLGLLTPGVTISPGNTPIHYEVVHIKGKLVVHTESDTTRLDTGATLASGDRLSTGWWSSAIIEAPAYAARIRVASRTRFRLAGEQPGVIFELDRGRLRAVFDALTDAEPVERIIQTPSAILAVRGTEYGIDVDRSGSTTLVVFSGTVETVDVERRAEPVLVGPGQQLRIRAGQPMGAPTPHRLSPQQWDTGRRADFDADSRSRRPDVGPSNPSAGSGQQPQQRKGGRGSGHG